jgi:hypothetical protein
VAREEPIPLTSRLTLCFGTSVDFDESTAVSWRPRLGNGPFEHRRPVGHPQGSVHVGAFGPADSTPVRLDRDAIYDAAVPLAPGISREDVRDGARTIGVGTHERRVIEVEGHARAAGR